jgi:hypothetical protein
MSNSESTASEGHSYKTLKKICKIDPKLFVSNTVKDTDVWSWKRKKFEKWFIFYDSSTGHLKNSKID